MKEIKEDEFQTATSKGTVLVDFSAEWCGPCKAMMPVLKGLATTYSGKLDVYSVDIDNSPALAAKHGVMSVPTMLLFRDGAQVDRIVGALSERDLKKKIDEHLGAR